MTIFPFRWSHASVGPAIIQFPVGLSNADVDDAEWG